MAHPAYLREKTRRLRTERKLTIDELAERLALSRSTNYYWVRGLPIPGSGSGGGWPDSARRKGNRAMRRKYRLLREAAYQEGLESFDDLASDPTFRDFVCMYVGEGYKRDRNVEPGAIRFQRKSNSQQLKGRCWRSRHGVLSVTVWDTLLRARLQAWIDRLRAEWGPESG